MKMRLLCAAGGVKGQMRENNESRRSATGRLRMLAAIFGLVFSFCGTAKAQQGFPPSRVEVSGSYSYINAGADHSGGTFSLHGGSGSVSYSVNRWFDLVADAGGYRFTTLPTGLDSTMYTYLFGPRFSAREQHHVKPFGQFLVGGGRLNASSGGVQAGENGFAMAVGGGLDVSLSRHFAVRAFQGDYLFTKFDSANGSSAKQNNIRVSAGLVFRF